MVKDINREIGLCIIRILIVVILIILSYSIAIECRRYINQIEELFYK